MESFSGLTPQAVLNSGSGGASVTDTSRKIIYWNDAAERITGWPAGTVLGTHCYDDVLCHVDKDGHRLCAIVILFVTDFQNLYKCASVGLSLFALLFIGAIYVLRWRRPEMERPFRVPGYPVVPAIFMVVTIFMAVLAFMEWRKPSAYSLGSILAGIPVYYVWSLIRRRGKA